MIYRVRTMTVIPPKVEAVRDVAIRAAHYVNEHYPGIHVEVFENIAGKREEVHMLTRCESLAALEEYEENRKGDAGWNALVAEVRAIEGVPESADYLYRIVS